MSDLSASDLYLPLGHVCEYLSTRPNAPEELQETPGRAPGELRDGFQGPSRELREQWDDLGMVPGRGEEAMSDLSLRFLMFLAQRTLLAYVLPDVGAMNDLSLRFQMLLGHRTL